MPKTAAAQTEEAAFVTTEDLVEKYRLIIPPKLQEMWDAEDQSMAPQFIALSVALHIESEWHEGMLDERDPDRHEFGICCIPAARVVVAEWLKQKLKEAK